MKSTTTKKLLAFIIMMSSLSFAYAQTCPPNKPYRVCCYHPNHGCRCKCVANITNTCGCNFGQRLSGEVSDNETIVDVFPNPVSESANILFYNEEKQKVTIKIFDMTGRHVKTITDDVMEAGDKEIVWNTEGINSGIYFIRVEAGNNALQTKISVVK